VLIALCVYFAGQPSAYVAMFIWVVLASGFFFPGRRTAIQMVWLLSVYAAVLFSIPDNGYSPLTRLLLTAIAFGTAAAVVSWLSESINRRVEVSESRARTDPLTGIANRRWLDEELKRELAWARRHRAPLCAAIVDLDDLKGFNDEHGHLAGDHLLVSAVSAWRGAIRPSDFIARVGGDEFMLLMPDCSDEAALAVLDPRRNHVLGGPDRLGRERERPRAVQPRRLGPLRRQGWRRGPDGAHDAASGTRGLGRARTCTDPALTFAAQAWRDLTAPPRRPL
jgi:diguanylate cyclase (GGDEF)-like protein